MRLKIGKTGKPTAKQRRKFYQYALDIYTGKYYDVSKYENDLAYFGFCSIFNTVFYHEYLGQLCENWEMLPELSKYKPKMFYTVFGQKTLSDSQFWFPCGDNEDRIKILTEILSKEF